MKKYFFILMLTSILLACSSQYKSDYTTKPVFCYQLSSAEQIPGKNCIGSGGHN